jgi:hypothetical protein
MLFACATVYARPQCPDDLDWLRRQCDDGALAYAHNGKIYLTELSNNKTELVGRGDQVEFSPDSSKLAWIDGSKAKGRMRKGDTSIHIIADNVDRRSGVHWISNTEVVVLLKRGKRREWYRVSLSGKEKKLPELNRLGTGRGETDVKLGKDGVWSYVSRTTWKTSDGGKGHINGNCSGSLSPDGRSVTGLKGDHRRCAITPIRKGGIKDQLRWIYDGTFDNHRWSSSDPRFVVCEDEKYKRMVVMKVGSTYCTRVGRKGENPESEMYGDFAAGRGENNNWLGSGVSASDSEEVSAPEPEPVALVDSWPGNTDSLVFLWENSLSPNEIFDAVAQTPRYCNGRLRGMAKLNLYHGMDLTGGFFQVEDKDGELLVACKESNQLTVEAVITIDQLKQTGPARIISFSSGTRSRNFTLGQEGDGLILRLRTPKTGENGTDPQVKLCNIKPERPCHLAITYQPGMLVCYLDGKRVLSTESIRGDFSNWSSQHLLFGDEWDGGRDWSGHLEGIAIYNRFMTFEEAKHNYTIYTKRLRDRIPAERIIIQARLLETTKTPTVKSLQEYPRALVVHTYKVRKVLRGEIKPEKILVAHWAFLDRKPVTSTFKRKIGAIYRLELERFVDNPQLESELQFNDSEDFELLLYYDVSDI